MTPKRQDLNLDVLLELDDRYDASDALGNILYGREGARHAEFREAFLTAIDDSRTSNWIPPRQGNLASRSIGVLLGAVWAERR